MGVCTASGKKRQAHQATERAVSKAAPVTGSGESRFLALGQRRTSGVSSKNQPLILSGTGDRQTQSSPLTDSDGQQLLGPSGPWAPFQVLYL